MEEASLKELQELRKKYLEQVSECDKQIARHPDSILSNFDNTFLNFSLTKEILSNIEYADPVSGWTDSRKNPAEYHGVEFKFKDNDTSYTYRNGGNWCSSIMDVIYKDPTERQPWNMSYKDLDRKVMQEGTDEDANVTDDTIALLRELTPHEVVGHMLYYTEGW